MLGRSGRAALGTIAAVGLGVVVLAGATAGAATKAPAPERGARRIHQFAHTTVPVLPAQGASAASAATGAPSPLLQNFNGVSSLDSAVTNFGAEFEPPDQGLCVGNGFVLEAVNSAFRVFRENGTSVAGPTNVNAIFGDGFKQFTSDPRCQYDPATHTWFATILFLNDTFTAGRLDIAVRHARDPRGPWRHFRIDVTHRGGNGCPCFGDQPLLGIDRQNIYVSTNEFSILGPQFNGAQLYVIDKHDLVTGARSPAWVHIGPLRIGGDLAFSVQPALTYGPSDAEYLMSSLDLAGTGDHRIGVWALTNRTLRPHSTPHLSKVVIDSERYAIPPPTAQKVSGTALDSGDDRMQAVQAIGGRLWGELGTSIGTGPSSSAGAAWFEVRPHVAGRGVRATISRQGYVTSPGNGIMYPSIAGDAHGNAAMGFSISGPEMFASAGFATIRAGSGRFGPVTIAAPGHGPYYRKSTRWGDYSWAVLDPAAHRAWLANEYIPPRSTQSPDGRQNWGTRVYEVGLPGR